MRWLAVAALCLAFSTRTLADDRRYKLVVNPKTEVAQVSAEFVRNAFLKKATTWGDGATVRPINLGAKFPVRAQFVKEVLRKTPAQLRNYWNQQIFSGKAQPPPDAQSTAELIDYVVANPGAIGYLPADVDAGDAKVVGFK